MSKATSIRGTKYEESFRKAFVHKNARCMEHRKFQVEKEDIYGKKNNGDKNTGNKIGDIDGYYISSEKTLLRTLLPVEHRLSDYDFVIDKGAHVFFELTTQSGDDLWQHPTEYIKKKVLFHKKLMTGLAHGWHINKTKHVLVFCFNGADNVEVAKTFQELCEEHGIRGTTAYLASDIVDQWDLLLQLAEKDRTLAEQNHALAEQNHALAEQNHALAEKDRTLAKQNRALAEQNHTLAERKRLNDEQKGLNDSFTLTIMLTLVYIGIFLCFIN